MKNLNKLAERVESGDKSVYGEDLYYALKIARCDRLNRITSNVFIDALNGSLDAAKALHDAVLPRWTRSVDATVPDAGIEVALYKGGVFDDARKEVTGDSTNEARAWVAAILRAKAQESDDE